MPKTFFQFLALILYLLSSILYPSSLCAATETNLATHVLIVANKNLPDSVKLAHYYAEKRGVPKKQICLIETVTTEIVSRGEYLKAIETPIREFMERNGLIRREPVIVAGSAENPRTALITTGNKIRYMVLCYGVPVKIAPDESAIEANLVERWPQQFRRSEAAVDSELALLPIQFPKIAFVPNPLYELPHPDFREPMNNRMILVTRLDGPSVDYARALVDRAIEGEKLGLIGRAYFDGRGITSGGYALGDQWVRQSYETVRKAGFESVFDENAQLFDDGYPMTDCVLYAGWYTGSISGALARKSFRFRTGAFAYHLHSDSAGIVRNASTSWVGPLVARGAAATMGCVYEPYLQGSPNIAVFFDRFLQGYNFAESAYASQQMLSWQTTFIGDPLYRPFAVSLEKQIALLEKMGHPDVAFAYLRRINLLLKEKNGAEALRYAREQNERLKSPVLTEKIGDMLFDEEEYVDAIQRYKQTLQLTGDDWQAIRIHYKLADAYQKIGKDRLALQSYETILDTWPHYEGKVGLYLKLLPLAYKIGPLWKANQWKADALRLNPSLTNNPSLK